MPAARGNFKLKSVLEHIIIFAELCVFFCGIYYLCIAFFSLKIKEILPKSAREHKFALLIAAHNEESVIADVVESLKNQNYPSGLYDIFVIADNCTDKTAEIAEGLGAKVIKRKNEEKKGKGYALEYAFDYIFSLNSGYEYAAVFDADNIVDSDFLHHINKKINAGARAVQGYLDSKNPYDSHLTLSYSLWYWLNNRLSQLSRDNLGLGARLGGTGFAVDLKLIKEFGWGATCLAEDTEFTLKLALADILVAWEHRAVVFDEKPCGMETSWHQRCRWVQGIYDAFLKYIKPLVKKCAREKNALPFHMVMNLLGDSLYPTSVLVMLAVWILTVFAKFGAAWAVPFCGFWLGFAPGAVLRLYLLANFAVMLCALYCDGKLSGKIAKNCLGFFVYLLSWIPIGIAGMVKKNDGEWFHTPHSSDKKDIG